MIVEFAEQLESGSRLLKERVYEELRNDIISCRIAPGAEVREADLATRFEVSKSPVRDALIRLEREGLIITMPRQGYRVSPVSISDMLDMFHLRAALERANIERVIRYATDEELAQLDVFKVFNSEQWKGGFVAYNKAFHRRLAELGRNPRMRDQLLDLIDLMERAVQMSVSNFDHGEPKGLIQEHLDIIHAIQGRLVKAAQKISEKHVLAAGKRVERAIDRGIVIS